MKNKITVALLVLVIIIGIIIVAISGFNLGFNYDTSKRLSVQFKESFEIQDVEEIAKTVLNNTEYKIDYIDEFEAGVTITAKDITDEQITEFENKLKEKYTTFVDTEEEENSEEENDEQEDKIVNVIDMPRVKTYDLVKAYVNPFIITTIVSIICIAIAFRKLGLIKALIIPICLITGINAVYMSAIAILRIPLNEYTISIGMLIYALSLIGTTLYTKSKKE